MENKLTDQALGDEDEMDLSHDEEEMSVNEEDGEDDDDETSEEEPEGEVEIQRLEEQLSINAFDYNCHVDLIKLLRGEGRLHRLRKARTNMSELFPLTEELWLDWLQDEIKLAEDSDRQTIYELFEKAVKDYICPDIWLEYAQYSIGGMGSPGGIEKVRAIFERGLTAVGLHMQKGAALWEAFREFESAILSSLQPTPGSVATQAQQELLDAQLEVIQSLFRRQLSIPLLDMEATYAEYMEWTEEEVPSHVSQSYQKALQQMEMLKPYEEALLLAEAPKLAEYQSYIAFEIKKGDPARIQIIFERAMVENCLVPDMWEKFTTYLDRHLKLKDLVLSTHERAVRNCPWTVSLWKNYLLAQERHSVEHATVSSTFEKSLNAGFIQATDYVDIWQSYIDYLRRRVDFSSVGESKDLEELRTTFSRSLDYLKDIESRFSGKEDLSCSILQIWARIEASHCKNMPKARELWETVMSKGNGKYANMWLEFYNLERAYGDPSHCRRILHRAVQSCSDYPEHVCEVLLTFERVEGSLEDWDTAVQKTESKLTRVTEQRARAAEKEAHHQQEAERKAEEWKKNKSLKKSQKTKHSAEKRKAGDNEAYNDSERPEKRSRRGDHFGAAETHGGYGDEEPRSRSQRESGASNVDRKVQARFNAKHTDAQESWNDNCSVFISNLAFTLEEPEEKLTSVFQKCGTIKQVRPCFGRQGTFRGYCYVQFEDSLAVTEALKMDRHELEGRPMFVSPCMDKSQKQDFKAFKYSKTLEKQKIFISGLPFSCTQGQLEELCQPHGTIKAIRLVTNRSGKPKGLAYVEFANESEASQAVLKMDGTVFQNYTISVAISNPPERKTEASSQREFQPVRAQTYGARGRGRTQLAMLPRSLHRQLPTEPKSENGTSTKPPEAMPSKPMSNADFAQMLLKK